MAILVEQVFANLTFADLVDGDGTVRQERVNVDEEERWIAPESMAERKLWPGPDLVDKCTVKPNEETVGAEVRDAEVENVGLHQPNVSNVPVTLSNSNVPSVFEETVNMQVGAGGSNMVAAFTGLKRR
nr:hypothetical protein Iba_chr14dCG3580 [Ipomoea batatas]